MRRFAVLPLLLALLLAACGEPAVTEPTPTPDGTPTAPVTESPDPDDTASPGEPAPTPDEPDPETPAATSTAYFVRAHESGEWVEPETQPLATPTLGVARAAMEQLVAGPAGDPALSTTLPAGTRLLDVTIVDRVLVVDLSGELAATGGGSAQELALAQQLAHTGAQFSTVDAVQLHIEGEPVTDLWGHLDWSEPMEPDPFALSPITFDSHEWGQQVPAGSVTVGGEANTFEATVLLRLIAPDGTAVEDTFTTASSGSGQRGTWTHTFAMPDRGRWTIEASEEDVSGGEGRPAFATRLELEVR
jgi:hypothetical protein